LTLTGKGLKTISLQMANIILCYGQHVPLVLWVVWAWFKILNIDPEH